MGGIELVAEEEPERLHDLRLGDLGFTIGGAALALACRHRSLQYFTSSQQRSHFFRQEKGR
jgi:hypothetical protein